MPGECLAWGGSSRYMPKCASSGCRRQRMETMPARRASASHASTTPAGTCAVEPRERPGRAVPASDSGICQIMVSIWKFVC